MVESVHREIALIHRVNSVSSNLANCAVTRLLQCSSLGMDVSLCRSDTGAYYNEGQVGPTILVGSQG